MRSSSPQGLRRGARFVVFSSVVGTVAAATALTVGSAGAANPAAHAARTINIGESGSLRLSNKRGSELKEQGFAKGTLGGPIYIQLRVISTRSVTAQVQVYPSGGLLRGSASANFRTHGSYASFSGHMNITGGSGRYSKAHGSNLSFTGTINRSNSAVSVHMSGRLSY